MTRYITDREWMSPTFEARPTPRIADRTRAQEDCEVGSDWHRANYPEDYCPTCGEYNGCDCPDLERELDRAEYLEDR